MRIRLIISAIIFGIIIPCQLFSQVNTKDSSKWYAPELIRLQYAGNTGMFASGASWEFMKDVIELAPSFGYAPATIAGRDIYIIAFKCIYGPNINIRFSKRFSIKPIGFGAVFSYTFKDKINKGQATENYPDVYYGKDIHCRMGMLYQAEFYAKLNYKNVRGLGIYIETSWWDVYLASKFDHDNNSFLNLWSITTLGLGTKLYF